MTTAKGDVSVSRPEGYKENWFAASTDSLVRAIEADQKMQLVDSQTLTRATDVQSGMGAKTLTISVAKVSLSGWGPNKYGRWSFTMDELTKHVTEEASGAAPGSSKSQRPNRIQVATTTCGEANTKWNNAMGVAAAYTSLMNTKITSADANAIQQLTSGLNSLADFLKQLASMSISSGG